MSLHSHHPLRLGLIGPEPPPNGGMAMQTEQLARLLRAEGVAVERLATNLPYRPAFVAGIPVLRAVCRLLVYLVAVWRLTGRVQVIHLMANSGWSWQLFSAPVLWLAHWRGTPVIVNYRGGEAGDYFQRSFRWVRPSLRKAAEIVVPSGFLEAVFLRYGVFSQVIPNIIDRALFHPPQAAATQADNDSFTLVITRNLEAIYGIDTAIRAFARCAKQDGSLRLVIAGSGPEYKSLVSLCESLGVSSQVTFAGRLDRPAVVALYASAQAMLNPSTVDNMPNSVLEALACGVPVVSTDVGGVPYIVKDEETALLVPVGDDEAMAAAILRLREDAGLRERLRNQGLSLVEQYTWPKVREQWLSLYHAIADGCSRVGA